MYAATLEYRIPVAKKVEAVLFTDVGSAWDVDINRVPWYTDDDSIHWSVGVGFASRLQLVRSVWIMVMGTETNSTSALAPSSDGVSPVR